MYYPKMRDREKSEDRPFVPSHPKYLLFARARKHNKPPAKPDKAAQVEREYLLTELLFVGK
jgi:hypothetical protein